MDPQKNLEDLKELKLRIKGKLVGGEEFYGVNKFYTLIENDFLDIVMPDIKYCGGIEEAINIGIKLESISDECFSIHCPSGPISLAGSAHVTSALSSKLPLEHAVFEIQDRHEFVYPNENIKNGKYIFCLPGSPSACKDAWDNILLFQLDIRHKPCNFVEILPRLKENELSRSKM